MKVTVEWLKDFVNTDATAEEIGDTLTMLGLELETVEDSALGTVLDFKVTPNRGDCLSVLGLARELCAKDVSRFSPTQLFFDAVSGWPRQADSYCDDGIVRIEDPDLCPRYGARFFANAPNGASSARIQARLTACGIRPISVVVDTTNFVMLELGQPLHAFDRDLLAGGRIVVRRAKSGEKIKTLDGEVRELSSNMLMICDAERPVAIGGVMGGENSEISNSTKTILLESAHFDPISVRRTRRALGMSTEASYRFERYVDPAGVVRALNRFADLLREQTGANCDDVLCDVHPNPAKARVVSAREARWNKMLGMDVPLAAAATHLQSLGCEVEEISGGLSVAPPSWRPDIAQEMDVVEEIGRLWGYEKIPEALPSGSTPQGGETPSAFFRTSARQAMLRMGFVEVANHTLCSASPLDIPAGRTELRNAAPELSLLRCSLLPGIAETAARNRGRALKLFEIGRVFGDGIERRSLGFLMIGRLLPEDWKDKSSPDADFFAAKGVLEELTNLLSRKIQFRESADPRFHATRRADISDASGKYVGVVGEIEATIAQNLDLPPSTLMAEICLERLLHSPATERIYDRLSPFPSARRDIAFSIAKSVSFANLRDAAVKAAGELLEDIWLADVYEGKGIPEGEHSIALAMTLRHKDRTLTDEEANEALERAFLALAALGARRRT